MSEARDQRLSAEYYIDADGRMDIEHNGQTYHLVRMLKYDQWAAVALIECEGARHVLKVSRCRGPFERLLAPVMNFVSRHEYRVYQRCDGIQGVPPLGDQIGRNAFLHEYIEGVTLDVNCAVPEEFFEQLEQTVREMHARGVAYVDLAKRENIIVGDDGRPYLIDFQVSFARHGRGPLAWLRSALVRVFQREDKYHLHKHRDRILRGVIPGYDVQYKQRRTPFKHLHRLFLRRPYLFLKRLLVPKHGDTTFYR